MADYDVVVVGAGNAAMAAAVSAREQSANRVAILEKAPRELRGGNTHYSGGLLRFAYERGEDLLPIPGLYACGEMVGGLFHSNYPGGTGLMSGAVFGRIAGANAAGA